MGSVQSYLSSQTTTVILVVAGVVTYTVAQKILQQQQSQPPPSSQAVADSTHSAVSGTSASKKSKKKKQVVGASHQPADAPSSAKPNVVAFPDIVPGSFEPPQSALDEEPASAPKPTKSKKKKGKKPATAGAGGGGSRNMTTDIDVQSDSSATAPESHPSSSSRPKKKSPAPKSTPPSTSLLDTDGPWTRVEPKKRTVPQHQQDQSSTSAVGEGPSGGGGITTTTSDAGITTSVTGNSSPIAERTEDESHSRDGTSENRRTLAEKLVPKTRKTGVDDMLETPDVPSLARVMRVQPRPDEQPAAGFTWADYEDVDDSRMTADDADGEDEGGWVVKSSRSRVKPKTGQPQQLQSAPQRAPEPLTKKQRQNQAKKEAQKEAKNAAETERLQTLARHKRELEKARMLEQHTSGSKKQPGGGMTASLNEKGQLVWE